MSVFVSAGFCCRYSMPSRDYSRVAALEDPPIGYNNFVRFVNKEPVGPRELLQIAGEAEFDSDGVIGLP